MTLWINPRSKNPGLILKNCAKCPCPSSSSSSGSSASPSNSSSSSSPGPGCCQLSGPLLPQTLYLQMDFIFPCAVLDGIVFTLNLNSTQFTPGTAQYLWTSARLNLGKFCAVAAAFQLLCSAPSSIDPKSGKTVYGPPNLQANFVVGNTNALEGFSGLLSPFNWCNLFTTLTFPPAVCVWTEGATRNNCCGFIINSDADRLTIGRFSVTISQ